MILNKTPSITIRMYNVGFGDCFLIRITTKRKTYKILVDCGSIAHATPADGPISLDRIIEQLIEDVTDKNGVPRIDVVICTHRHQDHIRGFADQKKWQHVRVEEVWMPWTENPHDSRALQIRNEQVNRAQRLDNRLQHMTSFAIDATLLKSLKAMAWNALDNRDAMQTLRAGFAGKPKIRYLPSGTGPAAFRTRALPGVRVHVLGPSLDESVIRDLLPPLDEQYLRIDGHSHSYSINTGNELGDGISTYYSEAGLKLLYPFDDWIQTDSDLQSSGLGYLTLSDRFKNNVMEVLTGNPEYAAASIANAVNGTSLMLMLEIGKHFLLLPGDAQWGTWNAALSNPASRKLLSKTTFLKVSHHGSENATPVSLVEEVLSAKTASLVCTRENTRNWRIPQPKLLKNLRKQLAFVVRSDRADSKDPAAVKRTRLYVDLRLRNKR